MSKAFSNMYVGSELVYQRMGVQYKHIYKTDINIDHVQWSIN